jgi:DNA-binding XRE family transcriptional regulator
VVELSLDLRVDASAPLVVWREPEIGIAAETELRVVERVRERLAVVDRLANSRDKLAQVFPADLLKDRAHRRIVGLRRHVLDQVRAPALVELNVRLEAAKREMECFRLDLHDHKLAPLRTPVNPQTTVTVDKTAITIYSLAMTTRKTGGEMLRQWRVDNDLSIEQAAVQLGCTAGTLYRWERGEYCPSLQWGLLLRDKCGIPLEQWGAK